MSHLRYSQLWYLGRLRSTFNSRLWHHLGHHISPSEFLHEQPLHSSSNIARTSYVYPNVDNVSWNHSVLWSNLIGQTFPTSLITRWCRNVCMYEDVSVTVQMSCPYSFSSEIIRSLLLIMPSARLVWKMMVISNFGAWCSIVRNTSLRIWATDTYCVIPLFLRMGTVHGNTDICLFLVQMQRRYLYLLLSHHHSSSCDLALLITPFSSHTLEQRHLSTRLHSSCPSAEICYEWPLDLDEQVLIANSNPCGFKGHWYLHM